MSFLLSRHDEDGDDHHIPAAPLDLLDEYWFFSNTLNVKNNNAKKKKPPPPPKSPSTSSATKPSSGGLGRRRLLLRTPSLPPPRMPPNKEELAEEQAEVDDDDLNWSSIYEGVLRTRIAAQGSSGRSSLQMAPSMPVPSSDDRRRKEKEMAATPSMPNNKLRHSYSTLERHGTPTNSKQTPRSSGEARSKQQQQPVMMVRSKSTLFQAQAADNKKWKSSSDLESVEVQGFKDLGFVFDKEELREGLADVLPGLKNATGGHAAVRRPYLSEAWHHDRRRSAPPALIRVQSEARSAAEMKDQLRMWAQAVACNVRQECA